MGGVVAAHQTLQLGKLADHVRHEIGLAECGGPLGLGGIAAHQAGVVGRQPLQPLHALALGAELLVEHHRIELRQPVGQRHLQVALPEESRIGEASAHDLGVTGGDRRPAVGGLDVGDEDEAGGELVRPAAAQHEALLVGADRGPDHLRRDREEALRELAHQHDRPFHQAGDLGEQRIVLDKVEALGQRQVAGVVQDDVAAAGRIQHHLGRLQRRDVIIEAAHEDRRGRHEAVAEGRVAGLDPADREGHDVRLLGLGAERGDDRMQWAHPAQARRRHRCRAPTHRLRPGEAFDHRRQESGQDVERRLTAPLDNCNVEVALLGIALHLGILDRGESGAFQEAGDGRLGRADLGPLALLAPLGLRGRQVGDVQRQPARRREGGGAGEGQAPLEQCVGNQPAQVLAGLGLHAGRDFFAEEFEQEIGHRVRACWRGPFNASGVGCRLGRDRRRSEGRPRRARPPAKAPDFRTPAVRGLMQQGHSGRHCGRPHFCGRS